VSYNSVGPDLTFLHKEMKLGRHSCNCGVVCFDEQTSHAQIPHWGYMLMPSRTPIHIDTIECLDSRVNPSRRGSLSFQNVFNGLAWLKSASNSVVLRESSKDDPAGPFRSLEGPHLPALPYKA
jgi:hypothetical protein